MLLKRVAASVYWYDRAGDLGVNSCAAVFKGIAAVLGSCDRS